MKKTLTLLTALVLMLSMLSLPALADDNFNETGYPIVKEPVTLKVIAYKHENTEPYENIQLWKDLEAKTNVKIEWQYAEGSDWNTQKQLVLAGGDLPDIFLAESLNENDVVNNLPMFIKLDDYIEKYAPNIKATFAEEPAAKSFATCYDGSIYGLPQQMPCRPSTFDMCFINQQWLTNLGLSMPQTTDELYTVLKAFKEQDANGNGDPNDEIPLSFMAFNDLTGCLSLFASFGAVDSMSGSHLSLTDGKVEYVPTMDGFKEGVKFLAKLYSEGLIDVEVFTQDWSIYPAKLCPTETPIVGMAFHWSTLTATGKYADQYVPFMPVAGPNGDRYWRYNPQYVKDCKYVAEITTACEYPEVAMRWLDTLYDQEISMQIFYGPLGQTMEKTADGYKVLDCPEGFDANLWNWKWCMNDNMVGYVTDSFSQKITPPAEVAQKLETDKEYSKYFKDEYFPLVNLNEDQVTEIAIFGTDLKTYWQETVATWITTNADVDAEWANYVDQMNAMGAEDYVKIYQAAYDASK